jgi:hypothetical protein
MNNTEKKLDALIDALGFDVEEIRTRDNEAYNHDLRAYGGMLGMMPANGRDYITTEFKLTKRDKTVHDSSVTGNDLIDSLDRFYDDVSLRQLVENVNQLSRLDKEYRWIKYPLDSYYAVKVYFSSKMPITSCPAYFKALDVKVMLDE